MCYVGEKLIEYYYTLLFRPGIATHVIVGERPTATTPDPRSNRFASGLPPLKTVVGSGISSGSGV